MHIGRRDEGDAEPLHPQPGPDLPRAERRRRQDVGQADDGDAAHHQGERPGDTVAQIKSQCVEQERHRRDGVPGDQDLVQNAQ